MLQRLQVRRTPLTLDCFQHMQLPSVRPHFPTGAQNHGAGEDGLTTFQKTFEHHPQSNVHHRCANAALECMFLVHHPSCIHDLEYPVHRLLSNSCMAIHGASEGGTSSLTQFTMCCCAQVNF